MEWPTGYIAGYTCRGVSVAMDLHHVKPGVNRVYTHLDMPRAIHIKNVFKTPVTIHVGGEIHR